MSDYLDKRLDRVFGLSFLVVPPVQKLVGNPLGQPRAAMPRLGGSAQPPAELPRRMVLPAEPVFVPARARRPSPLDVPGGAGPPAVTPAKPTPATTTPATPVPARPDTPPEHGEILTPSVPRFRPARPELRRPAGAQPAVPMRGGDGAGVAGLPSRRRRPPAIIIDQLPAGAEAQAPAGRVGVDPAPAIAPPDPADVQRAATARPPGLSLAGYLDRKGRG